MKFDCSERVGAPRGTSRSSGELVVHINTPRELVSPANNQLRRLPENKAKSLTSKRPARFTLRLETACLDEIGSQPEVLERSNVRICIDLGTEGVLAGQGTMRKEF